MYAAHWCPLKPAAVTTSRQGSKTITGQLTQYLYNGVDIMQQVDPLGATSHLRSLNVDEAFSLTNRDGTYFSIYDPVGSTGAAPKRRISKTLKSSSQISMSNAKLVAS